MSQAMLTPKKLHFNRPLLISNPINIRYLTDFTGVANSEREAFLLLFRNQRYLFTNSLYLEQVRKMHQLSRNNYHVVEISPDQPLAKHLLKILAEHKENQLEFESNNLTFNEYHKFKKDLKSIKLVPTQDKVERLRQIKRTDEIANIKQACRLTDSCFSYMVAQLKPGISEAEIAWKIEKFLRDGGAQLAFAPIVAFGKNSSQPHYSITERITLNTNSLVLLDFGARINGYCADMTRVVFIGSPSPEILKAYMAVLLTQQAVIDRLHRTYASQNLRHQLNGMQLDKFAKNTLATKGFPPYSHGLGHGLGLDIHEQPRLSIKKDAELKPGMVFTIEPAVYIEGKFGIRIEDTVHMTHTGLEILTSSSKILTIL